MGLPQMVQKFYSIKDRSIIPKAMLLATVFSLVIATGAYLGGACPTRSSTPQSRRPRPRRLRAQLALPAAPVAAAVPAPPPGEECAC